jgi:8-oxo-dGTP pyrophosphatase MutT (NUDIX family)
MFMTVLGAAVAIFQGDRLLLTQRNDFAVWCLPGGGIDPGESFPAAAIREAREETGLLVELDGLIGVYSRPRWNRGSFHLMLFAATAVGGALAPDPAEVDAAAYFSASDLPAQIMWGHRQMIQDAFSGARGLVWSQNARWPYDRDLSRAEIYAMRDRSGLGRAEFYERCMTPADWQDQTLESGQLPAPR